MPLRSGERAAGDKDVFGTSKGNKKYDQDIDARDGQGTGQGVEANQKNIVRDGKPIKYYTGRGEDRKQVNMGVADRDNPGQDYNPYTETNLEDFDLNATGAGSGRKDENLVGRLSRQDVKRLHNMGGHGIDELQSYIDKIDSGEIEGKVGSGARNKLANMIARRDGTNPGNPGSGGDEDNPGGGSNPGGGGKNPVDPDPTPTPTNPVAPTPPPVDLGNGNVSIGGNLDQNIGKVGDTNIDIGNGNDIGAGAQIGNDSSVTIGNQQVGGNNYSSARGRALTFLDSRNGEDDYNWSSLKL